MKIKELVKILQQLNPEGEACVADYNQDNVWEIAEVRTCEDRSSEWFKDYADIVIDCRNNKEM